MAKFPSPEWLSELNQKLNTDSKYAQVARNWEGDMIIVIEPSGLLKETVTYYLDLWHGQCRNSYIIQSGQQAKAAFTLKAPFDNYVKLLKSELDPMQALLTRKIGVQGNMAILMRNVPTVLDFVRCCREVTNGFID